MTASNVAITWNATTDFIANPNSATPTSNPNAPVPEWSDDCQDTVLCTSFTPFPVGNQTGTYVESVVGPGTSGHDTNDSTRFNASILRRFPCCFGAVVAGRGNAASRESGISRAA